MVDQALPATPLERCLVAARRQAHRVGLRSDDVEDCALGFVAEVLGAGSVPRESAWIERAARNHAVDYLRHVRVVRRCEGRVPEALAATLQVADMEDDPTHRALHSQARRTLWDMVRYLTSEQRTVILGGFFEDRDDRELARLLRTTPQAIRQCRARALHRLRTLAERRGLGQSDLLPGVP